jgi:CRP-like cAMP-binding protein
LLIEPDHEHLTVGITMPDPLVAKLQQYEPLSNRDMNALRALTSRVVVCNKRSNILREGDPCETIYLLRAGWACRHTILPDGKRQIISFVIPGDLCNDHVLLSKHMEHSIDTLTPCEIGVMSPHRFLDMLNQHPRISRALYWGGLVTEAMLRERIVTLGRRNATQRIAHLFCELLLRLSAAGLAQNHRYELPLTQGDIADTLGLTIVHVNRVIQTMRTMGLIKLKRHALEISNWDSLTALGKFDLRRVNGFTGNDDQTSTAQQLQWSPWPDGLASLH